MAPLELEHRRLARLPMHRTDMDKLQQIQGVYRFLHGRSSEHEVYLHWVGAKATSRNGGGGERVGWRQATSLSLRMNRLHECDIQRLSAHPLVNWAYARLYIACFFLFFFSSVP